MTYAVAFYLAVYLREPAAALLHNHMSEVAGEFSPRHTVFTTFLVSYVPLFIATVLCQRGLKTLCLKLSDRKAETAIEAVGLQQVDRLLGAGLGVLVAALLAGTVLLGLGSLSDDPIEKALTGSRLIQSIMRPGEAAGVPEVI